MRYTDPMAQPDETAVREWQTRAGGVEEWLP
jgi:hypothetical protein